MELWLVFLLASSATMALADHEPSHDDATVNYETVTQIINALHSKAEEDSETEESAADPSEETEDKTFQKRRQVYVARLRKPLPEVMIEQPDSYEPNPDLPCEDGNEELVEIIEEEDHPGFVGSVRGTAGVDYPAYTEIPLTSFTCADKKRIPGFYADVETDCQVFHVCYPHRRESFLCPVGTIFNQPILACDYWYSANCSAAQEYFEVEDEIEPETVEEIVEDLISEVEVEPTESPVEDYTEAPETITVLVEPSEHTFGPNIPTPIDPKPVPLEVHEVKPIEPEVVEPIKIVTPDIVSISKFLPVKAKVTTFKASLKPAIVKTKAKAVKVVAAKAKVAAAVKAVPVGKVVKAAAAKAIIGKAKLAPVVKTIAVKKAIKAGKVGLAKAKAAKLVSLKTYPVISALTKKQLALSLIKMMKAQKLRSLSNVGFGAHMYMY